MIAQPLDLNIRSECPACTRGGATPTFGQDRYGNDCLSVHCPHCGLAYWRNTREPAWYANFYESGDYRKLVSKYHKRDVMATIEAEQARYAERLSVKVRPKAGTHLLDIGGSTGVIANAFREVFNVDVTVLDPAKEFSAPKEVKHIQASAESYSNEHGFRWHTILMCQTIDHLLDPIAVLENCRKWLAKDGRFFVDILDVEQESEQKGWQGTLKVDHPYCFTDKSMKHLLANAGFWVEDTWKSAPNHIGYLCSSMG